MGRGLGPYFSSACRRTAFTRRRIMADKSVARLVYTGVALCFILCAVVVVMFTSDENATTLVETKAKWGGSLSKNEASPFVTPSEVNDKAQVQKILSQAGSVNEMLADSGGHDSKLQGNNFDGGDGELFQDWNSYNHGARRTRRNRKSGKSEEMEIDPATHKLVVKKIKNPKVAKVVQSLPQAPPSHVRLSISLTSMTNDFLHPQKKPKAKRAAHKRHGRKWYESKKHAAAKAAARKRRKHARAQRPRSPAEAAAAAADADGLALKNLHPLGREHVPGALNFQRPHHHHHHHHSAKPAAAAPAAKRAVVPKKGKKESDDAYLSKRDSEFKGLRVNKGYGEKKKPAKKAAPSGPKKLTLDELFKSESVDDLKKKKEARKEPIVKHSAKKAAETKQKKKEQKSERHGKTDQKRSALGALSDRMFQSALEDDGGDDDDEPQEDEQARAVKASSFTSALDDVEARSIIRVKAHDQYLNDIGAMKSDSGRMNKEVNRIGAKLSQTKADDFFNGALHRVESKSKKKNDKSLFAKKKKVR